MTEFPRFGKPPEFSGIVDVRRIEFEHLSTVRYIHAASMRLLAGHTLSEDEIRAFSDYVYSPAYADGLMRQKLFGAFVENELVATAGWSVADDSGSSIRIRSVFVRPLFTGIGIGRRLVLEVENDARAAGFANFSARATLNATGFFDQLGYHVTSHGVRQLTPDQSLPVAFMRKSDAGTDCCLEPPSVH